MNLFHELPIEMHIRQMRCVQKHPFYITNRSLKREGHSSSNVLKQHANRHTVENELYEIFKARRLSPITLEYGRAIQKRDENPSSHGSSVIEFKGNSNNARHLSLLHSFCSDRKSVV